MNCEQARGRLAAFDDTASATEVREHLAECEACRAEARAHRETWHLLQASAWVVPSAGFLRGVRDKAVASRSRVLRFLAPVAAAAAAILVAVLSMRQSPVPAPANPVAAAAEHELSRLSPEDRHLFDALNDEETWALVENLDVLQALDIVGAERLGRDRLYLVQGGN